MQRSKIVSRLERIENLPSLPIIVHQIQQLMANRDANMKQIALVIAKDQAIASRVIRLVNSAFYGLRERVGSIQHAIVVLGLNTIRNIVTGTAIVKTFQDAQWGSTFDMNRFWLHSIGSAMGCRLLALELGCTEPEDYFLDGLVHDIGILAIDQFFHEEFQDILKLSAINGTDYLDAEKARLECTHEDIGAYFIRKWKLPEELALTIQHHHRPMGLLEETESIRDRIAILHLAESKSRQTKHGLFVCNFKSQYQRQAFMLLRTDEKLLDRIFVDVEKEVVAVAKEWGVTFGH